MRHVATCAGYLLLVTLLAALWVIAAGSGTSTSAFRYAGF